MSKYEYWIAIKIIIGVILIAILFYRLKRKLITKEVFYIYTNTIFMYVTPIYGEYLIINNIYKIIKNSIGEKSK